MAAGVVEVVGRNGPSTHIGRWYRHLERDRGRQICRKSARVFCEPPTLAWCAAWCGRHLALFGGRLPRFGIDQITFCKQCCLLLLDICAEGPSKFVASSFAYLCHRSLLFLASASSSRISVLVCRSASMALACSTAASISDDRISLAERSGVRSIGLNGCERRRRRTLQSSCFSGCLVALLDQGRALWCLPGRPRVRPLGTRSQGPVQTSVPNQGVLIRVCRAARAHRWRS